MAIDNTAQTLGPVTVWTLVAVNSSGSSAPTTADNAWFPWGWAWIKEPSLVATGNRLSRRPGSMGSGSLTLLRDQRQEPTDKLLRNFPSQLVAGQYVCITGDSTSPRLTGSIDPTKILWWGWVSALNYSQVSGTKDGIGTATVLEAGNLLDQQQVTGWQRAAKDTGYAEPISSPPTANMANAAGYVIGNAKGGPQIGTGGQTGYAFARLPEDCGTGSASLWTRWRLLRHLLLACWPTSLPSVSLVCADGSQADDPSGTTTIAGFLNDTSCPEVYDLRNLTLKGAIDLCIPNARGFGWCLELVNTTGWQLTVYSHAALGGSSLGVPANSGATYSDTGTGIDLSADRLIADVKVVNETATLPDEIRIEGSPIVFGATVAFADGDLKEGWKRGSGNMEDVFRLGASAAAGYGSLAPSVQDDRNAAVRTSPGVRDVYSRFGLYAYANGEVTIRSGTPGDGTGGSAPICPLITWDGANLNVFTTTSRCPYLPSATLLRTLPWPEGVKADGTDLRPAQNQFLPEFMKPKIFRYDATDTTYPWVDFEARNGRPGYPSLSLDMDDRGAAFRVSLSQPEYLAKNHWTDAAGGTTSPAISDINPDSSPNTVDYTNLVATVAIESDQRVLVTIRRPGLTADNQVRKRLVLRDPALQCWMMPVGTILGIKADGTPDRVTGAASLPFVTSQGYVNIRNDFPTAQRRANMAAAWLFRPRVGLSIERADPTAPPTWARIGYLVTKVVEAQATPSGTAAVSLPVNTVVEEVSYDFGMRARVTVATSMPPQIGFAPLPGGASGGPTGGGMIALGLGGTVAQAVQGQQQAAIDVVRDTQRLPVILPKGAPVQPVYQVAVIGGNVLSSGQQGVKSASVTSVPSHYNPATDTSMVDGVGYGTLIVSGVATTTKVLVVNNGSGTTYNAFPLIVNDVILSSGTVNIPVGAGPDSVTCYTVG